MPDSKGIDLGTWALELLTAGAVAVLGWALSVVNRSKHAMEARVDQLEHDIGEHDTRLAVVQTCQLNTAERLNEIKADTHDTNAKLDRLIDAILKKDG